MKRQTESYREYLCISVDVMRDETLKLRDLKIDSRLFATE
jgi:hypothetical protein